MKDELSIKETSVKVSIGISIFLVIGLLIGTYAIVTKEPKRFMTEVEENLTVSEIVSLDPQETATNFIKTNGTMGNLEKDITQDTMKSGKAIQENQVRRQLALAKVKKAILPGSPLIAGDEENNIKMFTRDLISPYIYKVENVKVSEPDNYRDIVLSTDQGPTKYEAIDVYISFDSTRITFDSAKDTSYDGTHRQIENKEHFEEVILTLGKSGDLWFVIDIVDSEYLVNERFATWSGIGVSSIDYSKDEETGIFKVEGIIPSDEE